MRSARMLIVDRGNGNKARDDALRALDALLPSHWHIIGDIPPKPIVNAERQGSTEPFDALVIGEKSISVVNIVNQPGRVRVRIGRAYEVDGEQVAWTTGKPSSLRAFNTEVHKLCLLLRDLLDIDPYRVAGKMIWVGATEIDHESSATREEVTDIEQFVELAVTRDERMLLGPLSKQHVEAIAGYFLTAEQDEEEAETPPPVAPGESAGDFLSSPGEARPGAGAAERSLPVPARAAATTAMVRSVSFDDEGGPPGSPVYRFDDWAEEPDNFGPAPKTEPVRANGSGARTLRLWLGGGGLFAMGAATAALVMVAQGPRRAETVAAVPERDLERTQEQDYGILPQVIAPDPGIYGPVEDFVPAELPEVAIAGRAPPAAPQQASAARAQSAAATTRTEARPPRAPKAETTRGKSERPAAGRILCILPDGSEVQMARAPCRAQSGVIYR